MENTRSPIDYFGCKVFNDEAMRKYLPGSCYNTLRKSVDFGKPLDPSVADIVANGMKRWAIDLGATHFTHWFQPMTGYTAEKHDSFINPQHGGSIIMSFSGKELVRGESDASSFPSGGLRATFEARGYTAWDCTSPAFIKDNTLCIPTCFCSYTGDILDKKTPLLRSMEVLSKQALRIVHLFGDPDAERVISQAGAEQEYFLVNREDFDRRLDLKLCGRTLFGARPPKGQELDDHYYGSIKDRVMQFMRQADEELWSLGVTAKTEHNEVAPSQHELAPVYAATNIACDQNQLMMEVLKKVAIRNGFVCLLHEKPYARLNGSGKHNNWSLSIDGEKNMFDQGKTPAENARFLLTLAAVIWAVDEYAGLLRATVSCAGNDQRLGGNEAPPTIISVYLGDMLTDILTEIETGGVSNMRQGGNLEIGVSTIPDLPRDSSDRNRTSPFAFTGLKFEFRMLGSSMSIADCNTIINTIVAEAFSKMADRLESAEDKNAEARQIIRDVMREHKRVIFNGNNYSEQWQKEAQERGLPVIRDSVEAAEELITAKAVDLLEKYGILRRHELEARYSIRLSNYIKTVRIEAFTMLEMARREILPSVLKYMQFLAQTLNSVKDTGLVIDVSALSSTLKEVSSLSTKFKACISKLEKAVNAGGEISDVKEKAVFYRDKVLANMNEMRDIADRLEFLVAADNWPFPTYSELLFGE